MKSKETLELEKSLIDYLSGNLYGVKEVSLRKNAYESITERVDYITYDNKGIIRCYELKVTKSDFKSKAHLSFWGDYNYLVITRSLYEEIKNDNDLNHLLFSVGLIVLGDKNNPHSLGNVQKSQKKQVTVSQKVQVIESMFKSAANQLRNIYRNEKSEVE